MVVFAYGHSMQFVVYNKLEIPLDGVGPLYVSDEKDVSDDNMS